MDDAQQRALRQRATRLVAPARHLDELDLGAPLDALPLESTGQPHPLLALAAQAADARGASRDQRAAVAQVAHRLVTGAPLSRFDAGLYEAIILAEGRPALDVIDGSFAPPPLPWTHLDTPPRRTRLERAIAAVGRIEVVGDGDRPYAGTGFLVGDGLLMTNRHVAALCATDDGDGWKLRTDRPVVVDFGRERGGERARPHPVRALLLVHPHWDIALLRIEAPPHPGLRLAAIAPARLHDREIAVIGYPAHDWNNDPSEQQRIFDRTYQIKRLQPGVITGHSEIVDDDGRRVDVLWHDASTLGGNSGSLVLDLDSGDVVGVHFGGRYHLGNYAVPAYELKRDPHLIATGARFTEDPVEPAPSWLATWDRPLVGRRPPSTADLGDAPAGLRRGTAGQPQIPIAITVANGAIAVELDPAGTHRLATPAPTTAPAPALSKREAIRTFLTRGDLPVAVDERTESPAPATPVDDRWLAVIAERRRRLAAQPETELATYRAFYSQPDLSHEQVARLLATMADAIGQPAAFYDQLARAPTETDDLAPAATAEGVLGTLACAAQIPRWWPRRAPSGAQRAQLAGLRARYQLDDDLDLNPNDHDFEVCDPRWWPLLCEYAEEKLARWPTGLAPFRRHRADQPFIYDESARAVDRVALLADFGTGAYPARHLARQLERHPPPFVFHLGDVYYGGTAAEFAARYAAPLAPVVAAGSQLYSLPENHELYGEGHAYLAHLDAQRRAGHTSQEGSYFCVRFARHQLIGLDVNWQRRQRFLDGASRAWLDHVVATSAGRTTLLLTGSAPWVYGQPGATKLLDDLRPWVDRGAFDLWFWGDDHYAALFARDPARANVIGSCIGHGGYPGGVQRRGQPSHIAPRWVETAPRFPPSHPLRTDVGNNGWCEATLLADGGVGLTYIDWLGARRYQVTLRRDDGPGPHHTLIDVDGRPGDDERSALHRPR